MDQFYQFESKDGNDDLNCEIVNLISKMMHKKKIRTVTIKTTIQIRIAKYIYIGRAKETCLYCPAVPEYENI